MQERREFYANGLSYQDVKKLKITKEKSYIPFLGTLPQACSINQYTSDIHPLVRREQYKRKLDG